MKISKIQLVLFVLILHCVVTVEAQSTQFSFQGSLRNGNTAANGNFDFEFALFNTVNAGMQLGQTIVISNLEVTDGVFKVSLDFGDAFPGTGRYLEIRVRTAGSGAYTLLSPRQPIESTPYAVKSLNSEHAVSATNATSATTATNATQLAGQGASFYQNAANLNAGILSADRLPNPLYIVGSHDFIGTFYGRNTSVSGNGVRGWASSTTGTSKGVYGQADSANGTGVHGEAISTVGQTTGVAGYTKSPDGIGVRGNATNGDQNFGGYFTASGLRATGLYASGNPVGPTEITYGGYFETDGSISRGVYGTATSDQGVNYGGYFESASSEGRGLYAQATSATGTTYGVAGQSVSPEGRAVWGRNTSTTGVGFGGFFQSQSSTGRGVYGYASSPTGSNFGGYFRSDSSQGTAVYGISTSTVVTGVIHGGYFEVASFNGKAVYGEATEPGPGSSMGGMFISRTHGGTGVYGQSINSTGNGIGGDFRSNGTGGTAVYGLASATTGATYGGEFYNDSTSGIGVFGHARASSGNTRGGSFSAGGPDGIGVRGAADRGVFGLGRVGVWGENNGVSGWGVWSQGNFGASGNKAFRIDHPSDPENKYLLHYSIESPEVLNSYSGKVTLDENGEAVVEMPTYFASINKDPRYTLTPIGASMPLLHIAEEVDEPTLKAAAALAPGAVVPTVSFRIAGGVSGARVSWEVKAIRNDAWMRSRPSPVETEKTGSEKGKYLHPDLYGQPNERGISYDAEREKDGREKPKERIQRH